MGPSVKHVLGVLEWSYVVPDKMSTKFCPHIVQWENFCIKKRHSSCFNIVSVTSNLSNEKNNETVYLGFETVRDGSHK